MSFRYDFAGFVGGAVLCSLPAMAAIRATVYDWATERPRTHGTSPSRPTSFLPISEPVKPGTSRASYLLLGAMAPLEIPDKMPAGDSSDGVRRLSGSQDAIEAGRGLSLEQMVTAAAGLCGIDPALFWSLIQRESSGRHWDAEGRVLRSSAGALGLGQIKASTARGVSPHLDPMKPWDNAVASACYLRQALDRNHGNVRGALMDYHGGPYRKVTRPASVAYATDILEEER